MDIFQLPYLYLFTPPPKREKIINHNSDEETTQISKFKTK